MPLPPSAIRYRKSRGNLDLTPYSVAERIGWCNISIVDLIERRRALRSPEQEKLAREWGYKPKSWNVR